MITALRDQLAADLAPLGVPIHAAWPDRVTPPCVLVTPPPGRYVAGGPQFDSYTVALDVVVLVPRSSPSIALAALDLLIEGVLLNTTTWGLSGVDGPSSTTVGGFEVLGTIVHLEAQTRM